MPDETASQQAAVVVVKPKSPLTQVRTTTQAWVLTALRQGVISMNVPQTSTPIALEHENNNTNMLPRAPASGLTPERPRLHIMRRMSFDDAKALLNQNMPVVVL